jgi:hypothetical protein
MKPQHPLLSKIVRVELLVQRGTCGKLQFAHEPAASMRAGVIIPFYVYLDGANACIHIRTLLATMQSFPQVPVIVIINPDNGPGEAVDTRYATFIDQVRTAGGIVIGYVSTCYIAWPKRQVEANIRQWAALYPYLDGIFLDEMTWETGPNNVGNAYVREYKQYKRFANKLGLHPVVANAGVNQQDAYFSAATADIICCHENSTYPSKSRGAAIDNRSAHRASLVYSQNALDPAEVKRMIPWAKWVYVTNGHYSNYGEGQVLNPWDGVSEHLTALFETISECACTQPAPAKRLNEVVNSPRK